MEALEAHIETHLELHMLPSHIHLSLTRFYLVSMFATKLTVTSERIDLSIHAEQTDQTFLLIKAWEQSLNASLPPSVL